MLWTDRRAYKTPFEYLVLEVTQACPHACLHCYNYWREERGPVRTLSTLSRQEIRDLVRAVKLDAPLRQIAISGGEPLLRKDVEGIVTDLYDESLDVVVITSGSLLTQRRLRGFPKGTSFEITIFSADAVLHDRIAGRPGAFRRVVAGAAAVAERGCRLVVSVVVNQLNAVDVRRALELGIALGADGLLLNRMNISRITLANAASLVPDSRQLRTALEAADAVARETGATIAVSVPIPPCVVDPTPYEHLHFGWCPRGGPEAYYTVSHTGELRPCNHSSLVLGDLRTHTFAELVAGDAVRNFWAPTPSRCKECNHPSRNVCLGGCPAASRECFGTADRCDPLVELMHAHQQESCATGP